MSVVPHPQLNILQQIMGPAQPATTAASSSKLPTPTPMLACTPIMPITEQLPPAIIPWLEPNGSDWAIFMMCFKDSMKITGHWGYFISSQLRPSPSDVSMPMDAEIEAREKWECKDAMASYLLSQCLSDTTVMHMANCATAQD